ncbi:MAG: hypothetical protein ACE5EF_06670 [Dehalococcoidia bacterium]
MTMPMTLAAELGLFCEDHLAWDAQRVMHLFAGLSPATIAAYETGPRRPDGPDPGPPTTVPAASWPDHT